MAEDEVMVGDIFSKGNDKDYLIVEKVHDHSVYLRPCGVPLATAMVASFHLLKELGLVNITNRDRRIQLWQKMK